MSIAGVLPVVTQFLTLLSLSLSAPQAAHLARLVEALVIHEGQKTLARLRRLLPGPTSRSASADFVSESPWEDQMLIQALRLFFFQKALALAQRLPAPARRALRVVVRLDDTLVEKPKASKGFEGTDWHFDHTRRVHVFGFVFVTLSVSLGPFTCPLGLRLYLRAQTCRRLRRRGLAPGQVYALGERPLRFRSKLALARELLEELMPSLKEVNLPVYVLFDSWYAAKSLIRFCRRHGWHVVCALKSNRKLDGQPLRRLVHTLGKSDWSPVEVTSSAGERTAYRAASRVGRLGSLDGRCRVVFSLRNKRDQSPFYLLTTDLSLSLKQVLQLYAGRWLVEMLHWSLKVKLGFGDFRVRSLRGIGRWAVICLLAHGFLEWRAWSQPGMTPCEAIGEVRRARAWRLLRQAIGRARRGVRTQTILRTTGPLLV